MLNVVIYANCQGAGVENFIVKELSKSLEVNVYREINYEAIEAGFAGEASNRYESLLEKLRSADIFVFQPVSEKRGVFSTNAAIENSISSFLPKGCFTVSFPYAYNHAFWTAFTEDGVLKIDPMFAKAAKAARSEGDLLAAYDAGVLRTDFFNRFEATMQILEQREAECDVKISRFVRFNASKKRLFLTQNHPTTELIAEMSRQIITLIARRYSIPFYEDVFVGEARLLGENDSNLPGYYPIDQYALRHYNFEYASQADANAAEYYKNYLCAAYKIMRGQAASLPPVPTYA